MASVQTFTTTLTNAVGITDDYIEIADATGLMNPGSEGSGNSTPAMIQIDQEFMQTTNDYKFGSKIVPVVRAVASPSAPNVGSDAVPHAAGATVTITAEINTQFTY